MSRPAPFVIVDQPGLLITVASSGGGKTFLHFDLLINGEDATDDSTATGWHIRQMFPGRQDLADWLLEVLAWSDDKYQRQAAR